jgi:hypothetical protein
MNNYLARATYAGVAGFCEVITGLSAINVGGDGLKTGEPIPETLALPVTVVGFLALLRGCDNIAKSVYLSTTLPDAVAVTPEHDLSDARARVISID